MAQLGSVAKPPTKIVAAKGDAKPNITRHAAIAGMTLMPTAIATRQIHRTPRLPICRPGHDNGIDGAGGHALADRTRIATAGKKRRDPGLEAELTGARQDSRGAMRRPGIPGGKSPGVIIESKALALK